MNEAVTVSIEELRELVDKNLLALGLDKEEREVISDVLMYAELRGKAQGFIKILEKTVQPAPDRSPMQVENCGAAIHRIAGNGNPGMVVFHRAAELTISTCTKTGLALTGTTGTSSSTGSIGYYARQIANAGYIGVVMAGSPKVMALHGGRDRVLGTNPLAIAIPTQSGNSNNPLVLDMATSATTWFDIIHASRDGLSLADGVALDSHGGPTTDPDAALAGVLKTFAGSKGSGLALMIEVLTGPLMQSAIVGDEHDNRGNFLLAIDPLTLAPDFFSRVSDMLNRMRSAAEEGAPADVDDPFRFPGEGGDNLAAKQLSAGALSIRRSVLEELRSNVA